MIIRINLNENYDKKVSIIVPVYNCLKFFEKTISSIVAQNYNSIEIVIIDDGSTDGTDVIIDSYIT